MGGLRVGILLSGRGTTMAALASACAEPGFPAAVAIVLSDVPDAPGLALARQLGLAARAIDRASFPNRAAFEAVVDRQLRDAGAELVCLAGFMRLLSADFAARWHDRLVNIHPSLLPAFRGLDTHARAVAAGVKLAGCTVHFVRPAVDDGPIIAQAAVPVLDDDTPASLAARILEEEHRCYPMALRLIAEGRVSVDGERVRIAGGSVPLGAFANPTR